jgi:putative membrane protein
MFEFADLRATLPALDATLNAAATVLLVSGWICIRQRKQAAHIAFMVLALLVSAAFLTSYVIYHVKFGSMKFSGAGWSRMVYFPLLISHVILAVVNVPLVLLTVIPAIRRRFDKHKRMARWTLPVWLYVSVTGVIVYLMCYVWFV